VPYTSSGSTPGGGFTAASCGGPTPTPTPSLSQALWVENAIGHFVGEFKGATLTTPGVSVPIADVTNSSSAFVDPAGITFDGSGNQWVTVCGTKTNLGSITEFNATTLKNLPTNPAPAPDVVLTDNGTGTAVNCPWAIAFNSGNLWAANSNQNTSAPGFVTEYTPSQLGSSGHPTPNITLTDPSEFVSPTGVVFDSAGDLFVSDFGPVQFSKSGAGDIFVFKAATVGALVSGTNSVKADARLSDASGFTPVNGAFDRSGNLWVADCEANTNGEIYMFPKASLTSGATSATTVFQSTTIATTGGSENTIDCPGGIAFDANGNLWYTNFTSLLGGDARWRRRVPRKPAFRQRSECPETQYPSAGKFGRDQF